MTGRGLYELRLEWNKHFNLYFHHYSRADQSKVHTDWDRLLISDDMCYVVMVTLCDVFVCVQAEEAQRKLRRQNGEDTGKHTHTHTPECDVRSTHLSPVE